MPGTRKGHNIKLTVKGLWFKSNHKQHVSCMYTVKYMHLSLLLYTAVPLESVPLYFQINKLCVLFKGWHESVSTLNKVSIGKLSIERAYMYL